MQNGENFMQQLFPVEGFDNILSYDICLKEYNKLFKKDPSGQRDYQKWLDRQLRYLDKAPDLNELVRTHESFEKLRQYEEYGLYAIRRPHSIGNPRIMFAAVVNEQDQLYILLLAFKELNSSDYDRNIPVADNRMKDILQMIKEE